MNARKFEAALFNFLTLAQSRMEEAQSRAGVHNTDTLDVNYGYKYAKVVRITSAGHRYVHSFVDMGTGDIFKPASFKTPAKGVRGNIFKADVADALTPYGSVCSWR